MNEELKAVTEVAKTTGKAIDAAREIGPFIAKLIKGPLEQGIGIFEDKLKYMRWKSQVAIMDKVNQKMTERGLEYPSQAVPLKIAIPLLQAASMEEDNNLQDLWANLLVNVADKDSGVEGRRNYITILQDLTFFDAQILDKIYSLDINLQTSVFTYGLPEKVSMKEPDGYKKGEIGLIFPNDEVALSVEVLCRLGLLEPVMYLDGGGPIKGVFQTVLGRKFHKACTNRI